jgi:hypothetical protein
MDQIGKELAPVRDVRVFGLFRMGALRKREYLMFCLCPAALGSRR